MAWTGQGHGDHGGRVTFPYEFPQLRGYRIWIQVEGKVLTGVFDTDVGKGP